MDYSFFDDDLQARFTALLDGLNLPWTAQADPIEGTTVRIADDIDDETSDLVDAEYDTLFDEQASLAETRPGWITRRVAGVQVRLADGTERTVALDARLSNRLLEHFSAEEVAELVGAIAESLSRDYNGPLCKFPLATESAD